MTTEEEIAHEMVKLRELQKKLKEDINKYKQQLMKDTGEISEEDMDKIVEKFQHRVQTNAWILKKIVYGINRME